MANTPMQGDDDLRQVPPYLGPYENWNFGAGKPYAFPALRQDYRYLTALADYGADGPATMSDGITDDNSTAPPPPGKGVWKPTLWRPPAGTKRLNFMPFVVENEADRNIDPKRLSELLAGAFGIADPMAEVKPRFRAAFPVARSAMHAELPVDGPYEPDWEPDEQLEERTDGRRMTIVAVIDDGIPFAHRNFRDATGLRSRVECCWLQSANIDPAVEKPSVLFGREYTRERIEGLIGRYRSDEDSLYRAAGATSDSEQFGSLINRHGSHGAHVMDVATGFSRERGEQPPEETRIIAVQLPNTIAWDTSGFGKDMYMLSAFHYVFKRAELIAERYHIERPRLVINFSYGFSGGRHDGGTELELAIDEMIARRREHVGPTAVVLPAGNMFLERLHGVIPKDGFVKCQASIRWRIQPNDRTSNYVELWFGRSADPAGCFVDLIDPTGRVQGSIEVMAGAKLHDKPVDYCVSLGIKDDEESEFGQISADKHRDGRWRVMIALAPSEPEDDRYPGTAHGVWTILVRQVDPERELAEDIQCWIQRDSDPDLLHSGSRQSYFDDPTDVPYTPEGALAQDDNGVSLRRFGSLNGLATGSNVLVAAGFRQRLGTAWDLAKVAPADYSSSGPHAAQSWPSRQVDCSSMSDRSKALPGAVAAGIRSGSLSFVQGTSTAAPLIARELASAFATASDEDVEDAEGRNYIGLLPGWIPCDDDPGTKEIARLGRKRVPPQRRLE